MPPYHTDKTGTDNYANANPHGDTANTESVQRSDNNGKSPSANHQKQARNTQEYRAGIEDNTGFVHPWGAHNRDTNATDK